MELFPKGWQAKNENKNNFSIKPIIFNYISTKHIQHSAGSKEQPDSA